MKAREILLAGSLLAALPSQAVSPISTYVAHAGGYLNIAEDGSVEGSQLDSGFSKLLLEALDKRFRSWRFEPILVDGKPAKVRVGLQIELQASVATDPARQGSLDVVISNVNFPNLSAAKGPTVDAPTLTPPQFPSVGRIGVGATVILLIRVDDQGKAKDSAIEKMGLLTDFRLNDGEIRRYSNAFAHEVQRAASRWNFGHDTARWCARPCVVRVPISFMESGVVWSGYLPVQTAPSPSDPGSNQIVDLDSAGRQTAGLKPLVPLLDDAIL